MATPANRNPRTVPVLGPSLSDKIDVDVEED